MFAQYGEYQTTQVTMPDNKLASEVEAASPERFVLVFYLVPPIPSDRQSNK